MNKEKLLVRTLMCLLACATAACSSDLGQKEIPVRGEGERIAITATAGMLQDQPSTRLGFKETTDGTNKLKLTWRPVDDPKGKESFSVLSGTGSATPSTFTIQSMDASGATFTGEIIPADGTTYYAVYPALPAASPVAANAIPLVMTGQTGDDYDENKMYMYSSSTYNAGGTLNFDFQCLTSIVKATLKFPAALKGNKASDVTFIATDGLCTKADANIGATPATYSNKTTGSLALSSTFPLSNDANAETTVYLHVLPGVLANFEVTAIVNGKCYIGTVSASATIDAGKMYTKTVDMKEAFIVYTTPPSDASYNYNGLSMQIGAVGNSTVLATVTIANGKAVYEDPSALSKLYSLTAGTPIWVCIPKVVKCFHTLAAGDTGILTLPDKDKGSTLKVSPVAGGKAYENDWIVALYMGVNKGGATDAGAIPIYWATGNLIATKTSAANSGTTTVAFHIATLAETESEAKIDDYTAPVGISENASNGYAACATGSQWDKFGWGDATGLKTIKDNSYYAPGITTIAEIISGTANDIARVQLGGSWRLPTGGIDTNNEFAAFADDNFSGLSPDGKNWIDNINMGLEYTHTIPNAGNTITNSLAFPAAGYRDGTGVGGRGGSGFYWSGTANGKDDACRLNFYGSSVAAWGLFYRNFGQTVRPVTE